jgi:hypothetical protein
MTLAASPSGKRLAFINTGNYGLAVHWMTGGDKVHDLTTTESLCTPGWSSETTLWVLRKRGKTNVWIELDVDTGHETGRQALGDSDCSAGLPDLQSPVDSDVKLSESAESELRMLKGDFLGIR